MQGRRIFTVDSNYFPLSKMHEIVSYLHSHDQKYSETFSHPILILNPKTESMLFFLVLMIDPAVAYAPDQGYVTYDHGKALDIWLKVVNGSDSLGLVWPGKQIWTTRISSYPNCRNSFFIGITVYPG